MLSVETAINRPSPVTVFLPDDKDLSVHSTATCPECGGPSIPRTQSSPCSPTSPRGRGHLKIPREAEVHSDPEITLLLPVIT